MRDTKQKTGCKAIRQKERDVLRNSFLIATLIADMRNAEKRIEKMEKAIDSLQKALNKVNKETCPDCTCDTAQSNTNTNK